MECFAPSGDDLDLTELFQHHEPMYEPSLEDPKIECFARGGGNIDFYRLLEPTRVVVEPSMEDIELERFSQSGDDKYFDDVVELLKTILIPFLRYNRSVGKPLSYHSPLLIHPLLSHPI